MDAYEQDRKGEGVGEVDGEDADGDEVDDDYDYEKDDFE